MKYDFFDKTLILVNLLVYFLKKSFLSSLSLKIWDLNIAFFFLMEIRMPLVIHGFWESFLCFLDNGFKGA